MLPDVKFMDDFFTYYGDLFKGLTLYDLVVYEDNLNDLLSSGSSADFILLEQCKRLHEMIRSECMLRLQKIVSSPDAF